MANRMMANRIYTGQKDQKIVNAVVNIGATGAPTLDLTKSWGIASVTRSSAGKYVFTLGFLRDGVAQLDVYREFMGLTATLKGNAGAASVAPIVSVTDDSSAVAGTATITIQCTTGTGLAATDPANGEVLMVIFNFADGSAP